jgi:hypothetical protein
VQGGCGDGPHRSNFSLLEPPAAVKAKSHSFCGPSAISHVNGNAD